MRKLRLLLPALAVCLAASVSDAQAQQGNISGTVTEQQVSTPLASVQVRVQGLTIAATTDDQGRFVLNNVPAGTVTVVAQRLGFVMGQSQAMVTSGGETTVNLS